MTEIAGITIDAHDTRDIDDGFSVQRTADGAWHITVAIAAAGRTIKAGSKLDEAALERVATRYRPWGNEPMLPRGLSEDRLALVPDRRRRAMAVDVVLDANLTALWPPSVRLAAFRSTARLSYGRVAELLAAPPGTADAGSPLRPMLENARDLTLGLLQRRRAAGALAIYDLSQGWVATEEGFIKRLQRDDATVGYVIVQELMILANEALARFAAERGIPILYRNHTARPCAPDRRELAQLVTDGLTSPVTHLPQLLQQLAVVLNPATYDTVVRGHYGLCLGVYSHLTSPIRRYADLVSQRQIAAHLLGQPYPHTAEELQVIAEAINQHAAAERAAVSDRYRAAANARGLVAAGSSDAVAALDGPGLERAIKACIRAGVGGAADAPASLAAGLRRRLDAGTVPVMCQAVLLLKAPAAPGWDGLRCEVLRGLAAKPEDAASILAIARQMGWGEPVWTRSHAGPDHRRVFSAELQMLAPGERWCRGAAQAPRAALADQRAAVALLAGYIGQPAPSFAEPEAPPEEPPAPPKRKAHALTLEAIERQDPVSLLQEHCQGNGATLPAYTFDARGPAHAPTAKCTCVAMGVTRTGKAGRKQDAKRAAARAVLDALVAASGKGTG